MTLNFDPALVRRSLSSTLGPHSDATRSRVSDPYALRDQPVADAFVMLTAPLASEAFQQTEWMAERADVELLDRLRSALRQLRALWWAFEPLLDEKEARIVRKRFKRLADIAGEAHELDAACELLSHADAHPGRLEPVVRTLRQERRAASATSCVALRKAHVDVLLRRALADARRRLEARGEDRTLEAFARQRVSLADDLLSRREQRAANMKRVDAKTLHSIEEAAAKLQCLMELFAPLLERGQRHTMAHLVAAQSALVRLHDVFASEAVLRRVAAGLNDKTAVDEAVRWLNKAARDEARVAAKRLRSLPHPV
ncbi:CHAD domain protein [Caballeronia temeraria]|uniref:CHAD domain protein n=1 Tax=Caballeronia temeraria TaxID=1777137 RepID=A0A158APU1_9BURK|nr:CHAD domain-containing protein [Caballeronia temeraria]SAK59680.1 CHAD domain protein [Caballeronia temeraria]